MADGSNGPRDDDRLEFTIRKVDAPKLEDPELKERLKKLFDVSIRNDSTVVHPDHMWVIIYGSTLEMRRKAVQYAQSFFNDNSFTCTIDLSVRRLKEIIQEVENDYLVYITTDTNGQLTIFGSDTDIGKARSVLELRLNEENIRLNQILSEDERLARDFHMEELREIGKRKGFHDEVINRTIEMLGDNIPANEEEFVRLLRGCFRGQVPDEYFDLVSQRGSATDAELASNQRRDRLKQAMDPTTLHELNSPSLDFEAPDPSFLDSPTKNNDHLSVSPTNKNSTKQSENSVKHTGKSKRTGSRRKSTASNADSGRPSSSKMPTSSSSPRSGSGLGNSSPQDKHSWTFVSYEPPRKTLDSLNYTNSQQQQKPPSPSMANGPLPNHHRAAVEMSYEPPLKTINSTGPPSIQLPSSSPPTGSINYVPDRRHKSAWPNPYPPRGRICRNIVIDGNNVGFAGSANREYNVKNLELVANFFVQHGHAVTIVLPNYRGSYNEKLADSERAILKQLEDKGLVAHTPGRRVNGQYINSYDDRFIVRLAFETQAVIVSNDHFRDLQQERDDWYAYVEVNLLPFTIVRGTFLPQDDPLGRKGPPLWEYITSPKEESREEPQKEPQEESVPVSSETDSDQDVADRLPEMTIGGRNEDRPLTKKQLSLLESVSDVVQPSSAAEKFHIEQLIRQHPGINSDTLINICFGED